jgi:hypothetical protein
MGFIAIVGTRRGHHTRFTRLALVAAEPGTLALQVAQPMETRGSRILVGLVLLAYGTAYARRGFVPSGTTLVLLWVVLLSSCLLDAGVRHLALGICCPACRKRALRALARHPGFHQCSACGHRCKREGIAGQWTDASGPDDAPKYSPWRRAGTWLGYAPPVHPGKTTCGILLRNKWRRNPAKTIQAPRKSDALNEPMADPWLDC